MSKLKTRSYQLEIVNGTRRERSDFTSVTDFTSALPIVNDKGSLYVVAEPVGTTQHGMELCRLVTRVIKQEYYADTSTDVPSILVESIRTANRVLFQENLKSAEGEKLGVGVSCAVIHNHTVHIAQAQPAQAYLSEEGSLRRIPDYRGRVTNGELSPNWSPLGVQHQIQPEIVSFPFEPGNSICLCSTSLGRRIQNSNDEYGLTRCDAKTAVDHLFRIAHREQIALAHALVVEAVASKEVERARPSRAEPIHVSVPLTRRSTTEAEVSQRIERYPSALGDRGYSSFAAPGRKTNSEAEPRRQPDRQSKPAARMEKKAFTIEDPFATPPWLQEREQSEAFRRKEPRDDEPPLKVVHPDEKLFWIDVPAERPAKPRREKSAPEPEKRREIKRDRQIRRDQDIWPNREDAAARGESKRGGVSSLIASALVGATAIAGRATAHRKSAGRKERADAPGGGSLRRWLMIGLIAIVVGVAGFFALRVIDGKQQWAHFDSLIQQAEAKRQAALKETDKGKMRSELLEAVALAQEAGKMNLDQVKVVGLNQSLRTDLDQANGITRLSSLKAIVDLRTAIGDDVQISSLAAVGDSIYLLDRVSNSIYRCIEASGKVEPILAKGWLVDDKPVANMLAMTPTSSGIILMDGEGFVFTYDPGALQWHRQALGSGNAVAAKAIATFEGNLYVLGAKPNQILKYVAGRYSEGPQDWLTNDAGLDLTHATNLAVDGRIYVCFEDGSIVRLLKGAVDAEISVGVDPPLANSSQIITSADMQRLYLVDPKEKRILELDKDGRLQHQFRAPVDSSAFDDLRGVSVDDGKGKIFLVGGSQLYTSDLSPKV
jgi:serine/threonine protein phosphatase PrpC